MKVFTPFWRAAQRLRKPDAPVPAPQNLARLQWPQAAVRHGRTIDNLGLLPTRPDWAAGLRESWVASEDGAQETLAAFLDETIRGYAQNRDRPDRRGTSRLSPYLRFGQISPRQMWHATEIATETGHAAAAAQDLATFQKELGWREFSYHLLYHQPDIASANIQRKFDAFPWRSDKAALRAWQKGLTGYPVVDAGMRQLWQTGWMHNRVRMIAASFLIKHLLLDWRLGEAWFWDTLVDADPANNPVNWQWVAGSGADAAPYYRIFNPVLQGEKFDPEGDYVRAFVPELARMPATFIHKPWEAPQEVLKQAGVRIGSSYPSPIVDHAAARKRALNALGSMNDRAEA